MAATKLTLRMDEEVIERGKAFAKRQGTSLSKLLEQYLKNVIKPIEEPVLVTEVDAALGALFPPRVRVDENYELKRDYTDYYDAKFEKYLKGEEE